MTPQEMYHVDDVVQIKPEHEWGGCLVQVSEVKSWGIQGFVQIPLQGRAYVRLKWEDIALVGPARFTPVNEAYS